MRTFLPNDLSISSWDQIHSYFQDLSSRDITTVAALKQWMKDRSELEAVLEEDMAWRYIKMNIDTKDEQLQKSFSVFRSRNKSQYSPYEYELNKKLVDVPILKELNAADYAIYLREARNAIELYREENIPLFTELTKKPRSFRDKNDCKN